MLRTIFAVLALLVVWVSTSFAADWYVRPAGGDYGAEDGTSYENAWDGIPYIVWGPGGVQPGDTLWVSGIHIHEMIHGGGVANQGATYVISGTSETERIVIRGDASSVDPSYPDGIVWGAYLESIGPGWSVTPGRSGVYEKVLQVNIKNRWFFEVNDLNVDQSTPLTKKASLDEVESTPGSYYAASTLKGSTLYVRMTDSQVPTGRILFNGPGYRFDIGGESYITFKNITFYSAGMRFAAPMTHIRIDGGKFIYGESRMFSLFDGADYIEILNSEIAYAGNGIYNISNTNNAPSHFNFSGNYIHDIANLASKNQGADGHAIGIQGGHDGVIDGNFIERSGTGPGLYTWTNQESRNNIISRNYVRDLHDQGAVDPFGVFTQLSNNSYSLKTGNKFFYNIVDGAKVCYRTNFEDEVEIFNNVGINCGTGLYAGRSIGAITFENGTATINPYDILVGGTSGAAARAASPRNLGTSPNITGGFTLGTNLFQLNFESGGLAELQVGQDFESVTSGILNTARYVNMTSGSWTDGDAAGVIVFNKSPGSFIDDENFNLSGGQADIFTMVGNAYNTPFEEGEPLLRDGVVVATVKAVTALGPKVTFRNNIIVNSTNYHVHFATAGQLTKGNFDYNIYYPDGPGKFRFGAIETDFAGWQALFPRWISDPAVLAEFKFDPNSTIIDPMPLFENETGNYSRTDDFKPTRNSPSIDEGETQVFTGVGDIAGKSIVHLTDIGAHEYPYSTIPPAADAGPDQTVDEGDMVTLDATGSSDPIDGIASYLWSYVGPLRQPITLPNPDSPTPSYPAPEVGPGGETFTFQVVVTDNGGLTDTDTVTITVRDVPVTNGGGGGDNGGGGGGTIITKGPSCFISSVF